MLDRIANISQYYNTSERITALFVKITNEMMRTCRSFILGNETRVWDIDRRVFMHRVAECKMLNTRYQEAFRRAKHRLQEHKSERRFDFSENYGKC